MGYRFGLAVAIAVGAQTTAPTESPTPATHPATAPAAPLSVHAISAPADSQPATVMSAPADPRPSPIAQPLSREAAAVAKNIFLPNVPDNGPPDDPDDPPPPPPEGGLVLTGITVENGAFGALLENKEEGRFVWLAVGERLGPWRVERIELNRLVVKNEDGSALVIEPGGTLSAELALEETPGDTGTGRALDPGLQSILERMRRRREREAGGR